MSTESINTNNTQANGVETQANTAADPPENGVETQANGVETQANGVKTQANTAADPPANTTADPPASTDIKLTSEETELMEIKDAINNNIKLVEGKNKYSNSFFAILNNNFLKPFGINTSKVVINTSKPKLIKNNKYVFVTKPSDSSTSPYMFSFTCVEFDNKGNCIYDNIQYEEAFAGRILYDVDRYNEGYYYISDMETGTTRIALFNVSTPEKKSFLSGIFSREGGKKTKSQRKSNKKRKQQKSKKQRKSRK